jgi:methionine-rich copper-binding protein CopC
VRRLLLPLLTAVLAATLSVVSAAPASAHTRLVSSTPSQGGSADAPTEVVLVFSEPVQAGLSAMSVRGADGEEQVSGSPSEGGDGASVSQALQGPLEPGTYTVAYRVLAGDGHPVTGSFEITAVAPAPAPDADAATTTPVASPEPTPAATTGALTPVAGEREEDAGLPVLPLVLGAVVVVGVGGLLARRLGGAPRS